jgi:hypothetical protein
MTTTGTPATATPSAWTPIFHGIGQWIGEAVIGLIPLGVYELVHRYSNLPLSATCPQQAPSPSTLSVQNCTLLQESSSQEVCILAVVISGLAVLSVIQLGLKQPRKVTVLTRVLVLFALGALIVGSLFYGLITAHLERDATSVTYYALVVALLSSFSLAVEGALLNS